MKKHSSNAAFLKDLFHHLEQDAKGLHKEAKKDKKLAKETKKKYYPSKVKKHLHEDIKFYKKEAEEDKDMLKALGKKDAKNKKISAGERKFDKVLHEFKEGKLHSGSKKGPKVKSRKQALAIAFSEKRKPKKKA